jgi:hypothetical protein
MIMIIYYKDLSNIPIITSMDNDNDNNDINDNDLSTFIQYCKWKRTHINYRWYTHTKLTIPVPICGVIISVIP